MSQRTRRRKRVVLASLATLALGVINVSTTAVAAEETALRKYNNIALTK